MPIHDTHMSQIIFPTSIVPITGTWTEAAGAVAGTIAKHKAANAETATVHIPILIPSNASALKGSMLKSIEVDYELLLAAATSVTATLKKVTRGANTAVAVVTTVPTSQDLLAAAGAETQDQHKLTVSLTTPVYISNDEYYILQLAFVCGGVVTVDVLAAVANFTLRA